MKEVPDSPSSSRSNDSNLHIDPGEEFDFTDYHDDTDYQDGNESEYVGDSEYAENEFNDDDDDDIDIDNNDFPDPPNFEHILAMHSDLPQPEESYSAAAANPTNYNLHPDRYLPSYQVVESGASQEDDGNGNAGDDNDDDVIHYGFPRPKQPRFVPSAHDFPNQLDYNTDYGTMTSAVDDMSVSMGGYTSTNASCSDISGLCEIEDSEVNMSDNDSDAPETRGMLRPKSNKSSFSHTHTQV